MIPTSDRSDILFRDGIRTEIAPIKTHRMHIDNQRVFGHITNDIDAVKQMVYKCINTEKGDYIIYPSFGLQKKDLFFRPKLFAYVKLKHRIAEALALDDRITGVDSFIYHRRESVKNDLVMSFTVRTIYESFNIKKVFILE